MWIVLITGAVVLLLWWLLHARNGMDFRAREVSAAMAAREGRDNSVLRARRCAHRRGQARGCGQGRRAQGGRAQGRRGVGPWHGTFPGAAPAR